MRIIVVIFSLVFIFIMSINLMTNDIKKKEENVKVKIEKWEIDKNRLLLDIYFYIKKPVIFTKKITCKLFDKNKKEISKIEKKLDLELKKSKEIIISLGKVSKKVKYIDCSFEKRED